jgi:hypothetical protein
LFCKTGHHPPREGDKMSAEELNDFDIRQIENRREKALERCYQDDVKESLDDIPLLIKEINRLKSIKQEAT